MTLNEIAELYRSTTDSPGYENRIICPHPGHPGDRSQPNTTLFAKADGTLGAKCHSHDCPESAILSALEALLGPLHLDPPDSIGQTTRSLLWDGASTPGPVSEMWRRTDPDDLPDYSIPNISHSVLYYGTEGRGNTRSYRLDRPEDTECTWKQTTCKQSGRYHKHCWQLGGQASTCYINVYGKPDTVGPVFLVEGEKAARAVAREGYLAASYCAGGDSARTANYSPLLGYRVFIWPDNDFPGLKAARTSYHRLVQAGITDVSILQPVGASGSGHDAADLTQAELSVYLQDPPRLPLDTDELELGPQNITDRYLCLRFFRDHAVNLVIATYQGDAPSDIYAVLPNGLLSSDPKDLFILQHTTARRYGADITGSNLRGAELREAISHARSLDNNTGLNRLRGAAKGVAYELAATGIALELTVVEAKEVDADMTVMGFPNGVLDIRSGQFLHAEEARLRLVSTQVSYPYDPGATDWRVDRLLPSPYPKESSSASPEGASSTVEEDGLDTPLARSSTPLEAALGHSDIMDFWYRARGWMLTHRPDRELVAMITPGNAGKSTWKNADKVLGRYVSNIRAEALRPTRFSGGGQAHNGDLADFGHPRRIVYASEIKEVDTTLVNQISGGEDIRVREIKEKSIVIEVTAGLVLQGNPPEAGTRLLGIGGDGEDSQALRDRIRMIPMPRIPPELQVNDLKEAWRDPSFAQAYLARTVEWMRLMVDISVMPQNSLRMDEALQAQAENEQPDWRREWLPDALIATDDSTLYANSDDLYAAYISYYDGPDRQKRSKRGVTEAAIQHYEITNHPSAYVGKGPNRRKVTVFVGWRLRTWEEVTMSAEVEENLAYTMDL